MLPVVQGILCRRHLVDDNRVRGTGQFLRSDGDQDPFRAQASASAGAEEDRSAAFLGQLLDSLAEIYGRAEATHERRSGVNADANDQRRLALLHQFGIQDAEATE